ncbi:MAG: hypothetical protein JSR00_00940 [Bacteroidetes bacterium]|nr:hypothetical protein [Bacteroidota bacterium]
MRYILVILMLSFGLAANSQTDVERGFRKNKLFTGGSVTLNFSSNGSVLGANPVFGYSLTKWLDAGIVFNYVYSSVRHVTYFDPSSGAYYYSDDKLRQNTFGPGAFVRIFPVKFLFAHAQVEHNFISQKLIPVYGDPVKEKTEATSILVGGGYAGGREGSGEMFYYISVLFDVNKNPNSPYIENTRSNTVNVLPIIRAGIHIPLFQGKPLF